MPQSAVDYSSKGSPCAYPVRGRRDGKKRMLYSCDPWSIVKPTFIACEPVIG